MLTLGHEVEVLAPERFKNVPCPTYPEIRLALCTPNRVGQIIRKAEPDAIHIATEGPLGLCARWWLSRRQIAFTTSFHTLFPLYLNLRFGIPQRWTFKAVRRFHGAAAATMYSTPTLRAMLEEHNFSNLVRFSDACGADIPRWIRKQMEAYGDDAESIAKFGVDIVTKLCDQLLEGGAPGLHFYTMNRAEPVLTIWDNLDLDNRR